MTPRGHGQLARRVASLLASELSALFGETVDPSGIAFDVTPGSYRRFDADTIAWEASVRRPNGVVVNVQCYETMTECSRKGITVHANSTKFGTHYYASVRDL